jgi:type I restriction enzyme S subunit
VRTLGWVPLKHVAGINVSKLSEDTDPEMEFRYLDIGSVGRGFVTEAPETMRFSDAPSRARRLVKQGDTIVSTVRTYLRAVLPIGDEADELVVSTGFAVVTPRKVDPRFLSWYLQSDPFVDEVVARSVGVSYPAINPSEIGEMGVPMPDLAEQRAIADYLDTETTRIDALITKKRRLCQDLEARFRLIAFNMTTGSGTSLPLRRCVAAVRTGTTPPSAEMASLQGADEPWYSPGDVGDRLALKEPARSLNHRSVDEGWVPRFEPDSTLVIGIGATAGRVAHLSHPATGNQQMTCLVTGRLMRSRFLSWQLWARTDELRATAPYTTLPILNNDFLKSFSVVLPELDTQDHAVAQLDHIADTTAAAVAAIEHQIDLLVEHRQALITAAVTGEHQVPGLAA